MCTEICFLFRSLSTSSFMIRPAISRFCLKNLSNLFTIAVILVQSIFPENMLKTCITHRKFVLSVYAQAFVSHLWSISYQSKFEASFPFLPNLYVPWSHSDIDRDFWLSEEPLLVNAPYSGNRLAITKKSLQQVVSFDQYDQWQWEWQLQWSNQWLREASSGSESIKLRDWQTENSTSGWKSFWERSPVGSWFSTSLFRNAPATVPESVRVCGLKKTLSTLDRAPKMLDSVLLNSWDSFSLTLPSIFSETCVMYSSVIPGTDVFCKWLFLGCSCFSFETAANLRLFFNVAISWAENV